MTAPIAGLRGPLRDVEPIDPARQQGPVPAHLQPCQVAPRTPPVAKRSKLPDRPIASFVRGRAKRADEPVAAEHPLPGTPGSIRTEDEAAEIRRIASAMGRKGGQVSAARRAEQMTPEERSASARNASRARWARIGAAPGAGSLTGRPRTEMPDRPGCPGCGKPGTSRGKSSSGRRRWLCQPCAKTWSIPAPAAKPEPKGLAGSVRSAVRGLAAAGVGPERIAAFACGMFAARYGWERVVAWAGWIRRAVAPEERSQGR